ncbi:hypothetical protein BC830DRAFT_953530 [Chytriomyces sp. MP71]|nr:hypothetical protein BC830DRAFT_953530 [Chytriomyces sp. MP71]
MTTYPCLWSIAARGAPQRPCLASFTNPKDLHTHLIAHNQPENDIQSSYRCQWISCGRSNKIHSLAQMATHLRSHVAFKPFACACGTAFKWMTDLKKHSIREGHAIASSTPKSPPCPALTRPSPIQKRHSSHSLRAHPTPRGSVSPLQGQRRSWTAPPSSSWGMLPPVTEVGKNAGMFDGGVNGIVLPPIWALSPQPVDIGE